jgi:uncharacterized protein with HEPN domain
MKKRTPKLYINDILDCISKIEEYTADISFNEFSKKTMAIDAVVRNFEIMGEAAKHVPKELQLKEKDIPWKEMAGMRDKISHEYFGVDLDIVWKTIQEQLPAIKKLVKRLLQRLI